MILLYWTLFFREKKNLFFVAIAIDSQGEIISYCLSSRFLQCAITTHPPSLPSIIANPPHPQPLFICMFWGGGRNSYCFDRCREAEGAQGVLKCLQSGPLWWCLWAPVHPQSCTSSVHPLTASVSSPTLHCDLLGGVGASTYTSLVLPKQNPDFLRKNAMELTQCATSLLHHNNFKISTSIADQQAEHSWQNMHHNLKDTIKKTLNKTKSCPPCNEAMYNYHSPTDCLCMSTLYMCFSKVDSHMLF